jgi:hypothetical protein
VPTAGRLFTTPGDGLAEVIVQAGSVATANFGSATRMIYPVAGQRVTAGHGLTVVVPVTRAAAARRVVFSLGAGSPEGAGIDPRTGHFTWTPPVTHPPGDYQVTVRVSDPFEPTHTETATFMITVTGGPVVLRTETRRARPNHKGPGRPIRMRVFFSDRVRFSPDAVRVLLTRDGVPVKNYSKHVRVSRVVRRGRTVMILRFRSTVPREGLEVWVRNRSVTDALTGAPLWSETGSPWTILPV